MSRLASSRARGVRDTTCVLLLLAAAALAAAPDPITDAEALLSKRDYRRAEIVLREILKSDPSNARAHGNLALALLEQKKNREAIDEGRLAAAFGPEHPQARYIYGLALLSGGRPLEASRELEKAVAGQPDSAAALAALAAAYASLHDARAAAAYEKLILLEPRSARHRAELAEYLWADGRSAEGNRVTEDALAAFPNNGSLELRYGRALLEQQQFLDAAARLEAASEHGSSGEAFALLLASAYRESGRLEDAEKTLSAAVREIPSSPALRGEYGRLLLASGRAADALPQLEEAARLDPKDAVLALDLGRALETLGRLDEAAAAYRRAVALAPQLPRAHYAVGRLLVRQGKREEGEAELAAHRRLYERGLQRVSETEMRTSQLDLARVRLQEGKAQEALSLYSALPESADALLGKAKALASLGRHAEAVRALERARALDPEAREVESLLVVERSRAQEAR